MIYPSLINKICKHSFDIQCDVKRGFVKTQGYILKTTQKIW